MARTGKIYLVFILLLATLTGSAQFYPGPDPINPNREAQLLASLKHDTGAERILTLTSLANLYTFRPVKSPGDSQRAGNYLRQAEDACTEHYSQQPYNAVQQMKCIMLIMQNKFDLAARIPPGVDDTTRARLFAIVAFGSLYNDFQTDEANTRDARVWMEKAAGCLDSARSPRIYNLIQQGFGEILLREGKYAESVTRLNEVLARCRTLRYPRPQCVHMELAELNWIEGKYDNALANTLKALDYVNATNDSITGGDIHYYLAMVFRNTGQFPKAFDNISEATGFYRSYAGHLGDLYATFHMYGGLLLSKKKYREALEYYQQQYRLYPPEGPGWIQAYADMGDCYLKLKNYPEAEGYFLKEFDEKKRVGRLNESAYHRMAFLYVESGKFRQALPWLDSAERKIDPITAVQTKGHLYYMHFLADSATGNYISAIHYLQANKSCDEITLDRSKQAEVQRLAVQYETAGKNRQIELLQKSNQLYMANQRIADLVRNISIAAILLLGIVAFVFYRQYRNKEKMAAVINEKNKQLGILLNEKEWLLKEVHHRVKNNLHTVISLLDIQAEFLKDDALKAIENSQHRIYAMSLIHQKLYAGESLTSINLAAYIGELIGYLRDSFDDGSDLKFKVEVEPLDLDISIAIPVGLIINEVVSNSYKYAFPRRRKGNIIGVTIRRSGSDILIECWDNGIGLPKDATESRPGSLGLTLIRGLCKEINASLVFGNDNGTWIHIRIPAVFKMNSHSN